MNNYDLVDKFIFNNIDRLEAKKIVSKALSSFEDGELFSEYSLFENITLDESKIKYSTYNVQSGFCLRAILGDTFANCISDDISRKSLNFAISNLSPLKCNPTQRSVYTKVLNKIEKFYTTENPLSQISYKEKIHLLNEIDKYIRNKESKITQVNSSLVGSWKIVHIIQSDGSEQIDIRPQVQFRIGVVAKDKDKTEAGSCGKGGRFLYSNIINEENWKQMADEAIRMALVNLEANTSPTGEMPVILGCGWSGVLLHEAVGHGLEGDFNRKKTSVYSGKIGEQVTAKNITIVDDGTILNRRGSINIDDEGTPTQRTILVEDGILKNYMTDKINAKLLGVQSTGNGRRESYLYAPQVRMTNTFMLGGEKTHDELISSVQKGIYAKSFTGGQVDISSGKFVFTTNEAYVIQNGKIDTPIKNATLIGSGFEVMNNIDLIANNSCLDDGIGSCGKGGQMVPVGVGMPSVRIKNITVGGKD